MATLQLNEKLMRFALFKGMGHEELARLVTGTKLDFVKLPERSEALRAGDRTDSLLLLLDGRLQVTTSSADTQYSITEYVEPPSIIEPERLFGLHQASKRTFTASTPASLIAISKVEVARLCTEFMAFRLNMLNLIATKAQQFSDAIWSTTPASLSQCIARFVASRCISRHGTKVVTILMERLAAEVNDSRLDVSRALRAMQDEGIVQLARGKITIPDLDRLMQYAK